MTQRAESEVSFLEKRNRRATRKSVIRAACLGAGGGFTLAGLKVASTGFPGGYLGCMAILIAMTVVGAIAGAAVEWQVC
jgi:hypothetical protein